MAARRRLAAATETPALGWAAVEQGLGSVAAVASSAAFRRTWVGAARARASYFGSSGEVRQRVTSVPVHGFRPDDGWTCLSDLLPVIVGFPRKTQNRREHPKSVNWPSSLCLVHAYTRQTPLHHFTDVAPPVDCLSPDDGLVRLVARDCGLPAQNRRQFP